MMKHIAANSSQSSLEKIHSDDIQPNAVDLRLDRVWKMGGAFIIDEESKTHRDKGEISPTEDGWFNLPEGRYEIAFDNTVKMGETEAGFVITRSTLNRNGVFITSGLYDSGYHGALAACMHISGGPLKIRRGTRVGQFLLWEAIALHKYDGSYGFNADGSVKQEEQMYHADKDSV